MDGAHDVGISSIYSPLADVLASGDENGCIKLWDTRAKKSVGNQRFQQPVHKIYGQHKQCIFRL